MKRRIFLGNLSLLTGGSGLLGWKAAPQPSGEKRTHDSRSELSGTTKEFKRIHVTVPSTIGINEPFWIGIRILTEPFIAKWVPRWQRTRATIDGPFNQSPRGTRFMDNVLPEWDGEVSISGGEGLNGASSYSFKNGTGPYESDNRPVRRLEGYSFSTPGLKYIRVQDPVSGIVGISNVIHVNASAPKERLYWGNLHSHSFFGDGIRCPEEIHAFARDESFLEVFALTDHTEALTNAQWNYFREVTNTFNEPNRFVAFNGGEWTSPKFGHRNFIYPGNDGPILRSTEGFENDLDKLYAVARNHKALIIANHTASKGHTTHWENGHDPEVERLVEVYSIGGVNERPAGPGNNLMSRVKKDEVIGSHVVDGLERGYRLGLIGAGDDHDGRPGDALHHLQEKPADYKFLRGPGLMGVWAKDLTRQSVFDALWNRRVFGTTNNRTMLKFTVNGQPMGSEFKVSGKVIIQATVASHLNILRMELVKGRDTIRFIDPAKTHFTWRISEQRPTTSTWYYVRVILEDENLAWSSPVWVNV